MKKNISNAYHYVRWQDGSTIGRMPLEDAVKNYGAPYYLVHRADLHAALLDAARRVGVEIFTEKNVTKYDLDMPGVKTADGQEYMADLIIAADGEFVVMGQLSNKD